MSKNLFLVVVCCSLLNIVVADEIAIQPAASEIFISENKEVDDVELLAIARATVKITYDGRNPSMDEIQKAIFSSNGAQIELDFVVRNEKTVEFFMNHSVYGSVGGVMTTEDPEYIQVLSRVTQENQDILMTAVSDILTEFLSDNSYTASECEEDLTDAVEEILQTILFELEGARAFIQLYQDLIPHLETIINEQVSSIDPSKSLREAIWDLSLVVNNETLIFYKKADLAAQDQEDSPLYRLPLDTRFAVLDALNNYLRDHIQENQATEYQSIQEVAASIKNHIQILCNLVETTLKQFYPAL